MRELTWVNVPDEYTSALKLVELVTGNKALIAGGAIRDLIHGRPVKDLDVFTSRDLNPPAYDGDVALIHARLAVVAEALQDNGYEVNSMFPASVLPDETDLEMSIVFSKAGALDLNLCLLRTDISLHTVASRVDFGICQACCDSDGRVFVTDDFVHDSRHQVFTLRREEGRERSIRRYERLKEKYHDWPLVL